MSGRRRFPYTCKELQSTVFWHLTKRTAYDKTALKVGNCKQRFQCREQQTSRDVAKGTHLLYTAFPTIFRHLP